MRIWRRWSKRSSRGRARIRSSSNLDSDLKLNKPQLAVDVDREKVAAVGAEVDAIGRTLETLLGGRQVTRFKREGKQYDVIVRLEDKDRVQPTDLTSIYVRAQDGQLVQLSNLVQLKETVAPKELNHFNRLRAAIITASLAPDYTLGEALDFLEQAAREELGPSAQTTLDGESREYRESGRAALSDLRAGARFHLSRAVRAVRELRRAVRDHAHGAACDDRRAGGAAAARRDAGHRRHAQRLQQGRAHHAGGAHHQARHPDRRVRQPAHGAGPRQNRRR